MPRVHLHHKIRHLRSYKVRTRALYFIYHIYLPRGMIFSLDLAEGLAVSCEDHHDEASEVEVCKNDGTAERAVPRGVTDGFQAFPCKAASAQCHSVHSQECAAEAMKEEECAAEEYKDSS